jgi:voltage-gated potassium channel
MVWILPLWGVVPMFLRIINILTLLASLLLLASLSVEIIYSRELAEFSDAYAQAMLVVCLIFIIDFFALMWSSVHPWRFLARNFVVLVLSIPYHAVAQWWGLNLGHSMTMVLSGVAMLRAVMALYITLRWLIVKRATRLLWAYVATVVVCNYFAALFFYEYEAPVNDAVHGFGDALWWASMNLTTVGAEIAPVTTVGKVICVILPIIGMAMFPVFTVYITSLYDRQQQRGMRVAEDNVNQKQDEQ